MYIIQYARNFSALIPPTHYSVSFCPLVGGRSGALRETHPGGGGGCRHPVLMRSFIGILLLSHETSNIITIKWVPPRIF